MRWQPACWSRGFHPSSSFSFPASLASWPVSRGSSSIRHRGWWATADCAAVLGGGVAASGGPLAVVPAAVVRASGFLSRALLRPDRWWQSLRWFRCLQSRLAVSALFTTGMLAGNVRFGSVMVGSPDFAAWLTSGPPSNRPMTAFTPCWAGDSLPDRTSRGRARPDRLCGTGSSMSSSRFLASSARSLSGYSRTTRREHLAGRLRNRGPIFE